MGNKTDGNEYEHHDPRKKKKSHYDQVWDILEENGLKMMGDHEVFAATYDILGPGDMKVGSVTFDSKSTFTGGQFYGDVFVDGRTNGKHEAFFRFTGAIGDLYDS